MTMTAFENRVPRLMRARGHGQAPPNEIKRTLKALHTREMQITRAEERLRQAPAGSGKAVAAKKRVQDAVAARDYTRRRIEAMLSYATTHTFSNKAPQAQAGKPFIEHVVKTKDDIFLCAEVAAKHTGSNAAFEKLVAKYQWLIDKFTRPGTTNLEPDDACSGGLRGIWDAALRFDPLRQGSTGTYAAFATVAYSWVLRNTRSRTRSDARDKTLASYELAEEVNETHALIEDNGNIPPKQIHLRSFTILGVKSYTALAQQDRVRGNPRITDETLTTDDMKALYKLARSE